MEGVPPGPGWYVGEWSHDYESWTWQWCGDDAPHAPGPSNGGSWSDVQDDAFFMQWYRLADDWSYVPRDAAADDVPAAAADDVPGQPVAPSDAPSTAGSTIPSDFAPGQPGAPGDALEQAQVQSAIQESINDQNPPQPSTESQTPDQFSC